MNRAKHIAAVLRVALILFTVCVTMAVSCPRPEPEPTPSGPAEENTKSKEYRSFEDANAVGLYVRGKCVLSYDESSFQESVNVMRRTYRMQSDDQTKYMNVEYSSAIPSMAGDECDCKVSYSIDSEGGTLLVVKLIVIKTSDDRLWLWNEFQKTGIVIPVI